MIAMETCFFIAEADILLFRLLRPAAGAQTGLQAEHGKLLGHRQPKGRANTQGFT